MPTINLKYGNTEIPFDYDDARFDVLGASSPAPALSDVEIGWRLDAPVDSKPLEEIVQPGETVLLVVPDATRQTASGQTVNLIVRRLIANGTMPFDISIIFATGIHRSATEDEKKTILTTFIWQRIKTLDHNARDLANIVRFGETADKIPIELNRALTTHDRVIVVGGISFHYFAGFTGGRKLICPGLASTGTIAQTHRLAFDGERQTRRENVDLGILNGNPVHEAFVSIVEQQPPAFAVNNIVNDQGELTEMFCGDWRASHEAACEFYAARHTIRIEEKRNAVVASCGGAPHDINLIQAHKALETASRACADGGTIILLAECADGTGRSDFLDWFKAENSTALARKLGEKYQVNGQTAWNLLRRAENFNVRIVTALSEIETSQMRLQKAGDLNEALATINADERGYILPFGAKFLIEETFI